MLAAMGEFDLIARFFTRPARQAVLGVGDDCALLQPRPGTQMAISTDMLVQGRHFFADVDPQALGHKSLAVNLSDLAACGARPLAFTLALSLPEVDEAWLAPFAQGLLSLADEHQCELIGGDTTRGPLNICITVFGEVLAPGGHTQALLRSGAQVGDDVYVSGHLGDARLALEALQGKVQLAPQILERIRPRLERPKPRVALGMALRGIATAAIDISDGLSGDLGHILQASKVGAQLDSDTLFSLMADPHAFASARLAESRPNAGEPVKTLDYILAGGDDYELAFTAPASARTAVTEAASISQTRVSRIGCIDTGTGLRVLDAKGRLVSSSAASFDHFA
ncbi:MAG: hypothetical protein RL459_133 [Pseudomonadota bacterium]